MEFLSAALILFFVMDPLGNIPVFTTVLSRVAPERRRLVLTRELLIALFERGLCGRAAGQSRRREEGKESRLLHLHPPRD